MLFQRLYNWIKYKTLPPSFLFKNRLFIERDSKHKRILSNFGLSFRSSKWSNYESYNIKHQFKSKYLKLLKWVFGLIIAFLILWNFKYYYIYFYFFNTVSFVFWMSVDAFDYYTSFLVWLLTVFISVSSNLIYSYFFFNHFSSNKSVKEIFSDKMFQSLQINSNFREKDLTISKHDLNWILYSWLTNPRASADSKIFENVFDTAVSQKWWDSYYDFFIKLYRVAFFLNLTDERRSIFNLNLQMSKIANFFFKGDYSNLLNCFNNSNLLNKYSSVVLWYVLNNYKTYFDYKMSQSSSLRLLNNSYEWNLYNVNTELDKYAYLLKNKTGLFYFNDFSYQNFSHFIFNFTELWTLNDYVKNQLNSAKWNRWLYRYSILHRKVLKNSHKLTTSKRLINSGFYNSEIFDKNLWMSAYFGKSSNPSALSGLFNIFYKDLFARNFNKNCADFKISILNNGHQANSLNLLNFYENSYFWFLKRFYSFNTLPTNFVKSKLISSAKPKTGFKESSDFKNENSLKYFLFLSYLLKSPSATMQKFWYNVSDEVLFEDFTLKYDHLKSHKIFFEVKDFYLFFNENDMLSKDNLNVMNWITSRPLHDNQIVFFDYLTHGSLFSNLNNCTFSSESTDTLELDFWLTYSFLNNDGVFLNDLLFLSLFY